METVSIMDGLVLTVVSMLVVFIVLTAIWGLIELVSKILISIGSKGEIAVPASSPVATNNASSQTLNVNEKNKQAAEVISLVLASEDQPNKKFEIVDSKRVK